MGHLLKPDLGNQFQLIEREKFFGQLKHLRNRCTHSTCSDANLGCKGTICNMIDRPFYYLILFVVSLSLDIALIVLVYQPTSCHLVLVLFTFLSTCICYTVSVVHLGSPLFVFLILKEEHGKTHVYSSPDLIFLTGTSSLTARPGTQL